MSSKQLICKTQLHFPQLTFTLTTGAVRKQFMAALEQAAPGGGWHNRYGVSSGTIMHYLAEHLVKDSESGGGDAGQFHIRVNNEGNAFDWRRVLHRTLVNRGTDLDAVHDVVNEIYQSICRALALYEVMLSSLTSIPEPLNVAFTAHGVFRQREDENGGVEYFQCALHHDETSLDAGERRVPGWFVPAELVKTPLPQVSTKAAIQAAEHWASASYLSAKNAGAGGPGLPEQEQEAQTKCEQAILILAGRQIELQPVLPLVRVKPPHHKQE